MEIKIINESITNADLVEAAKDFDGEFVKAVVDVSRRLMAIGGTMHSDEESVLLEDGSIQEDLWGINIYPAKTGSERIEFDSMINIRPKQENRSRNVEDPGVRKAIMEIVDSMVAP